MIYSGIIYWDIIDQAKDFLNLAIDIWNSWKNRSLKRGVDVFEFHRNGESNLVSLDQECKGEVARIPWDHKSSTYFVLVN